VIFGSGLSTGVHPAVFSFVDLPTVPFDENFVLSLSQALSFFHSTNAISIK